jgi:hypothetical protein
MIPQGDNLAHPVASDGTQLRVLTLLCDPRSGPGRIFLALIDAHDDAAKT